MNKRIIKVVKDKNFEEETSEFQYSDYKDGMIVTVYQDGQGYKKVVYESPELEDDYSLNDNFDIKELTISKKVRKSIESEMEQ